MNRSVVPAVLSLVVAAAACDSPLVPVAAPESMAAARVSTFEPGRPLRASSLEAFIDELQLAWITASAGLPLHDTFLGVTEASVSISAIPHRGHVSEPAFEDVWSFGKKVPAGRLNNPGAVAQSVAAEAVADLRVHLRKRGYAVN